jgi:hypothetical protein
MNLKNNLEWKGLIAMILLIIILTILKPYFSDGEFYFNQFLLLIVVLGILSSFLMGRDWKKRLRYEIDFYSTIIIGIMAGIVASFFITQGNIQFKFFLSPVLLILVYAVILMIKHRFYNELR